MKASKAPVLQVLSTGNAQCLPLQISQQVKTSNLLQRRERCDTMADRVWAGPLIMCFIGMTSK